MKVLQSRPKTRFDEVSQNDDHKLDELGFQKLKVQIHEQLIDELDLSMLAHVPQDELMQEVQQLARDLIREQQLNLDDDVRERMVNELFDEVFGLGPLEVLMQDDEVSDILVNNAHETYIERRGRLEETKVIFADDKHLIRIIQRIVSRVGRRIDELNPMVDARLPDGSRINAVIPPMAIDGPSLSIRRFGRNPLSIDNLLANQTIHADIVKFLAAAVDARVSFLVSGGTGAGKTTLLNSLTKFIPDDERVITIEDSAELQLQHRHTLRMETRPANNEGTGEITQRALVRNSLRMRPDRIIIGEVRGAEALDMLQAMNTGHEGSLTTIHSNDAVDALGRLELMVAMAGYELPIAVVRQYILAGISLVVHVSRLKGGVRKLMQVSEIVGIEDGQFQLQDIFGFRQTGIDADGCAKGEFYVTGYRPQCLTKLHAAGIELDDSIFEERIVEVTA